jgi:hypothetical protein
MTGKSPIPANQKVNAAKSDRLYSSLRFPMSGYTHGIILMFQPYQYETTDGVIRSLTTENSTIILPLPSNLQDSYKLNVGGNDLGMTGGLATDLASTLSGSDNLIGDIGGALKGFLGDAFTGADRADLAGIAGTGAMAAKYFARNALSALPGEGNISAGIDVATGAAINPHTTVTFEGVNLKNHSFQWNLSPKNADEARILNDIIRKIKSRILPQYRNALGGEAGSSSLGRGLLSYPDIVHIMFTGINNEYFYYFKPAMVESFDINYAPNGVALNRGGKPSTISISMTVTEAKIHTRDDVNVGVGSDSNVGGSR